MISETPHQKEHYHKPRTMFFKTNCRHEWNRWNRGGQSQKKNDTIVERWKNEAVGKENGNCIGSMLKESKRESLQFVNYLEVRYVIGSFITDDGNDILKCISTFSIRWVDIFRKVKVFFTLFMPWKNILDLCSFTGGNIIL